MKTIVQQLSFVSWRNRYLGTIRHYGTDRVHPGYKNLRKHQERMQVDDGSPIHLKKGLPDKVLYYTSMILGCVGVAWSFKTFYNMIYPSKDSTTDASDHEEDHEKHRGKGPAKDSEEDE